MMWRRPTAKSPSKAPALTSAEVGHIYRALLRRSPSADEVALQLAATSDWRMLLEAVSASDECNARQPKLEQPLSGSGTPRVNIWHPDLSRFGHSPGTWSLDGEAVMGKEGWVFLGRGSNSVVDQYQPEFALPIEWADRWAEVVQTRRNEADELDVALMLLVVPDKLSVLSRYLPDDMVLRRRPPVAVLSSDLDLGVTYPVEQLAEVSSGAYLRTDTHLSLAGNAVLATIVIGALIDPDWPTDSIDIRVEQFTSSGDLGRRFEPSVVEIFRSFNSLGKALIIQDNHDEVRAAGRHLGTRRVLRNDAASDPRTVVVFGDSYSFPATHYQGTAWFLAQHFKEVHFIWSPFGWDRGYVERVGARAVVCETAERFVPRPPELRFEVAELTKSAVAVF